MVGLAGLATLRRRPTLLILEVLSVALLAHSFHELSFGFSPHHNFAYKNPILSDGIS